MYSEKANDYNNDNAGIDLYVPETVTYENNGAVFFLDHHVICRMTRTNENGTETPISYYLYPRSSMSKTPFRLANSVGIIDAGYRGNIIAALDYIRGYPYQLEKGQRIVQICAPTLEPIRLVICDNKDEMDMNTQRSSGGFGSSGK
jgi:dUTP pyrophosphatase